MDKTCLFTKIFITRLMVKVSGKKRILNKYRNLRQEFHKAFVTKLIHNG